MLSQVPIGKKPSIAATFIGFVGILIIAGILYLILRSHSPVKTITDFAQCKAAGHPIQESYPEACVTPDGQRFTNPDQKVAEQICPDAWYKNEMPSIANENSLPNEYFVVGGQRREVIELDVAWIIANCKVSQPEIIH